MSKITKWLLHSCTRTATVGIKGLTFKHHAHLPSSHVTDIRYSSMNYLNNDVNWLTSVLCLECARRSAVRLQSAVVWAGRRHRALDQQVEWIHNQQGTHKHAQGHADTIRQSSERRRTRDTFYIRQQDRHWVTRSSLAKTKWNQIFIK